MILVIHNLGGIYDWRLNMPSTQKLKSQIGNKLADRQLNLPIYPWFTGSLTLPTPENIRKTLLICLHAALKVTHSGHLQYIENLWNSRIYIFNLSFLFTCWIWWLMECFQFLTFFPQPFFQPRDELLLECLQSL